jgi:hypothetical protein
MNVVSDVADVIAVPRQEPADSFVLHAPLELLARTALLPMMRPDRRDTAMRRIADMVDEFEGFGEPVAPPASVSPTSATAAAAALVAAADRGDLDAVDAYSTWIGDHVAAADLPRLLADAVVPRLSAAGHAPIFLWLYPRVAPNRELTGRLLRQLCRELARHPDWRIGWIDEPVDDAAPADLDLFATLADAPRLGRPTSTFIHPLMSRVDVPDLAPRLLAPLLQAMPDEVSAHGTTLTRLAAWSMLGEPTDDAPYGWSHCLTMPQAVLGVAGACASPARALAVAATHVLGFRASLAHDPLDRSIAESWTRVDLPLEQAIAAGPETARAALWHLPESAFDEATTTLATGAATHHDAHLVKYTLACLDAAAIDPSARRLYLAAAATLAGWWAVAQSP